MELSEHFFNKILKTKTCWYWRGAIATLGYGQYKIKGKQYMAHRLNYAFHKGPIPDGMILDHVCRVRNCVNPMHLEVVTQRQNVHRGIGEAAINRRKTHCVRGHEFNEINTNFDRTNRRICRVCKRAATAAYRRRNPGKKPKKAYSPEERRQKYLRALQRHGVTS